MHISKTEEQNLKFWLSNRLVLHTQRIKKKRIKPTGVYQLLIYLLKYIDFSL